MRIVAMADCKHAWNEFVDSHPHAWWYHRTEWLEFEALNKEYKQGSFAVFNWLGHLVAICPLLYRMAYNTATMPDGPLPRPLVYDNKAVDAFTIRNYIDEQVSQMLPGAEWVLRGETLVECGVNRQEGLQTRIIDLSQNEDMLHSAIRKSYQHLINKGIKLYEFTEGWPVVGELQSIRRRLGRTTSPDAECMMTDWVKAGHGLCIGARERSCDGSGPCVGANYIIVYKHAAYYMSGAYAEPNVSHALQWRSMQHMRRVLKIKLYEIGLQGSAKNEKEIGIEQFKAGFGGENKLLPVWRVML